MRSVVHAMLLAVVGCQVAAIDMHGEGSLASRFRQFQHSFGRHYDSDDEAQRRFGIFRDNMRRANELSSSHGGYAQFGVTMFSDLTAAEFARLSSSQVHAFGIETICAAE